MTSLLFNPVYHALRTGDKALAHGTKNVKYFDETVSPFVGIREHYDKGFDELFALLPAGRKILYATPEPIKAPRGWQLLVRVKGIQMKLTEEKITGKIAWKPVPLKKKHVPQMLELASLTRPGPFGPRTIDFGFYYGIFEGRQLVAMTGQRLHVGSFTEVSAVCTHPDHLGKGYAAALVQHQIHLIQQQGRKAILHVRKDNERAIAIYERLGFTYSGDMNFYFMKRRTRMRKR